MCLTLLNGSTLGPLVTISRIIISFDNGVHSSWRCFDIHIQCANVFNPSRVALHLQLTLRRSRVFWIVIIEMFLSACSQRLLLLYYFFKIDYLKYLPVSIVASHTHYDKEGNSYSMGTCIAEKGKTKYMLFKVPGGSKYAVTFSAIWCTLLFLNLGFCSNLYPHVLTE